MCTSGRTNRDAQPTYWRIFCVATRIGRRLRRWNNRSGSGGPGADRFRMPARQNSGSKLSSGNIVVLTGAGVSRESGLHTFRDPDGIWARVNIDDVATPDAFSRDPARVHEFYNARRQQLVSGTVHPNRAHFALADLERSWPGNV